MNDQDSLAKLQKSWPETTDYLRRVGQVNNDLAVLREMSQREEYEVSLTWLDHLEVGWKISRVPQCAAISEPGALNSMAGAKWLELNSLRCRTTSGLLHG